MNDKILPAIFRSVCLAVGLGLLMAHCKTKQEPNPTPAPATYAFETTPTWSDEFDYTGLPDATKWSYDVGGNGWGNHELEYYTQQRPENARVENGHLVIEARRENWEGSDYTSARLVTKGKGDWTYGDGSWPDNGEIDLMEHVGYDPGVVHATIHCNAYNEENHTLKSNQVSVPDAYTAFHVYTLEWTPLKITAAVDGNIYFTFNAGNTWQTWPFDKKFHLLLNIAVGGDWGGEEGIDDSIWPQRLEVDYVRVYKLKQ